MTFNQIGRPIPMRDGRGKVTGAAKFTADLDRPGLLHARLVVSIHPHARIRAVHKKAALTAGASAVLTYEDLPNIPPKTRGRLLLARGRVVFAGQPIALVLADSPALAEDAARLVEVDYEALPAAITVEQALAEDAPLVWPEGAPGASGDAGAHGATASGGTTGRNGNNVMGERSFSRGDVAAGFAQADAVIERIYTTPWVHQSSVEPQSILAEPNAADDGFTIYASTQGPFEVRKEAARALGLPETQVKVVPMAIGGGFGGKNGLYEPLVALAAQAVRRPVLLTLTRSEEMIAANPAPWVRIRLKLGAKSDGSLTALEGDVVSDDGCYPFDMGGFLANMLGSFYRVPNVSVHGLDVLTFKVSAGAYRAPGAPSVIFALDSMMEEMAGRLGLDPLAFRLANAVEAGDPILSGEQWPAIGMKAVLEAVQAHPLWRNREESRARGRAVGLGVGGWLGGTEAAAAACGLHRDGVLQINVGSVDLNGTATAFALIAAEVFGVSADQVRVVASDTDTAPYAGASAGSKVTYTTGAAVAAAAKEARRQVLALAAEELEASVDDLEIVDGGVQVRGVPSRAIKLGKLASKTMTFGGKRPPVFAQGHSAQPAEAPAFSAQLAEVSVDEETGEVRLHKLVVAQDVGRAINPLMVEGQMAGGAIQGVGWALFEDLKFDEGGQLLSGTWLDYAVPAFDRTPTVETLIVEVPSETGPFGARGVGEAPVIPTAAAVANAVAAATGARVTSLPLTPPRVLAALQARG